LAETLKEGGRGASGGRGRAQSILVAVEMALALVLLVGAGLMIRSLIALWNVDPGFRPDNVLTFRLDFPPSMRTGGPEAVRANLRELSDQLNSLPGVRAASFSNGAFPLQFIDNLYFWIEGRPKPASNSELNEALVYRVEPGYLTAMGIPLKQGRFFTELDNERSPSVVVIDEALARKYFPNEDPIGKRLDVEGDLAQIVGVVGHIKQLGLDSDDQQALQAQLYQPFRQISPDSALWRNLPGVDVVVRAGGTVASGGAALFDSIRRAAQSQNGQNVISRPQTMNEVIAGSLARQRFSMILLDAFAAAALLLASVGLYGVISYLVGQRTQELGVRIALGAQRADILRLILTHGLKMAIGGVALGLVAALGLTRLLEKMLYGVSVTDPATFTVIPLLLTTVALVACLIPAWRATKVDPMIALRRE
jgi:predicted permease